MSAIFLIGMPGAGKTYWGKEIGAAYDLPFIDLDGFIEMQEQLTIPEIFAAKGEDSFRLIEQAALKSIIAQLTFPAIIACGGGTPVFFDNMQVMKEAGTVVYLEAPLPILYDRLQETLNMRPILKDEDSLASLLEILYVSRKEIYEQADHILNAIDITVATFTQIIDTCINKH